MLTYNRFEDLMSFKLYNEPMDYLGFLLSCILTIPLDILLFPLEIIAYILYKIFGGKDNEFI